MNRHPIYLFVATVLGLISIGCGNGVSRPRTLMYGELNGTAESGGDVSVHLPARDLRPEDAIAAQIAFCAARSLELEGSARRDERRDRFLRVVAILLTGIGTTTSTVAGLLRDNGGSLVRLTNGIVGASLTGFGAIMGSVRIALDLGTRSERRGRQAIVAGDSALRMIRARGRRDPTERAAFEAAWSACVEADALTGSSSVSRVLEDMLSSMRPAEPTPNAATPNAATTTAVDEDETPEEVDVQPAASDE